MGSGGFTIASPLNVFVEPGDGARVAAELIRIFRDHGSRDARSKCRFAFLIEAWGLPRLREELCLRLGRDLEPAGRDVRGIHDNDHLGIAWQNRPGYRSVGLCVPEGRIGPDQIEELSRLADEHGDGQVRLTTGQNAILPNVPQWRVPSLLSENLLQELSPSPSAFRRGLVACTGTDYCNLAQIDTKGQAAKLAGALEKKLGSRRSPVRMHWSGCPAGCGNHEAADIGFRGLKTRIGDKLVEAVAIYVGGRTGPHAAAGQQLVEIAPCDETLPLVVANLIRNMESAPDLHSDFDPMVLTLPAATNEDVGRPQGSTTPSQPHSFRAGRQRLRLGEANHLQPRPPGTQERLMQLPLLQRSALDGTLPPLPS